VKKVQKKHQQLNDARIEAYAQYKKAIASGASLKDTKLPLSEAYAQLLDKYT
jgi:hypothetical protein